MTVVLPKGEVAAAIKVFASAGFAAYEIGSIVEREPGGPQTVVL
jgi:hypothetical protein